MVRLYKFCTLLFIFLVSLSGCENDHNKKLEVANSIHPPNVVIFIADDVSWNDLGCYGNSIVQTPNIDNLASSGIRFTNVYLTASSCSPSRNSIITGRYPHNTGAAELHTEPPLNMVSFPEILRKNEYYCVQAGKFHMGEYAKRGFDVIYDNNNSNGDGGEDNWVQSVQERPRTKPFFMWLAAYDAHRVWGPNDFSGVHNPDSINPPDYLVNGPGTKMDLAQYYDEVKRFDHHIGEVVKELKTQEVFDNTIIVVMADNGRPFPHSKTRVNDRGMKTPFIIHWPDGLKHNGKISNSLISSIDIAPTILELGGIDIPDHIQGYSFKELLDNPEGDFRNYIFAEHNWHDYEAHERMVRDKDHLYILNSRPTLTQIGPLDALNSESFAELIALRKSGQLSDLQSDIFLTPRPHEELYDFYKDPSQLHNVASLADYNGPLTELRAILTEWMRETGDGIPDQITKNWYLKSSGNNKTEHYNIRGDMPGSKSKAVLNNNKGRF
jgi:N-sulfoglucosamine sulfohydrolase